MHATETPLLTRLGTVAVSHHPVLAVADGDRVPSILPSLPPSLLLGILLGILFGSVPGLVSQLLAVAVEAGENISSIQIKL